MKRSAGSRRVISDASHPRIGVRQHLAGAVPVPLVGVHRADDDVVLQHRGGGEVRRGGGGATAAADAGEADDAAGGDAAQRLDDHLAAPVHSTMTSGSKPTSGDRAGVIGRAERAHEIRLRPGLDPIEHVHLEPVLLADQRRQQADRPGAGHEHRLAAARTRAGRPASTCSHALATTVVGSSSTPRMPSERRDLHRVLGLDAPALGHEAVDLLDAALGVLAVAAHVPLADGAVRARHGVRPPDDADDQVPFLERAAPGRDRGPGRATRGRARAGSRRAAPSRTARGRSPRRCRRHPTAMASTSTEPSCSAGSGISSRRAVSATSGSTVMAFMWANLRISGGLRRIGVARRDSDPANAPHCCGWCGLRGLTLQGACRSRIRCACRPPREDPRTIPRVFPGLSNRPRSSCPHDHLTTSAWWLGESRGPCRRRAAGHRLSREGGASVAPPVSVGGGAVCVAARVGADPRRRRHGRPPDRTGAVGARSERPDAPGPPVARSCLRRQRRCRRGRRVLPLRLTPTTAG